MDFDGVIFQSVDVKTRAFEALFSQEKPEHLNPFPAEVAVLSDLRDLDVALERARA